MLSPSGGIFTSMLASSERLVCRAAAVAAGTPPTAAAAGTDHPTVAVLDRAQSTTRRMREDRSIALAAGTLSWASKEEKLLRQRTLGRIDSQLSQQSPDESEISYPSRNADKPS